jgi:hypothetical protein
MRRLAVVAAAAALIAGVAVSSAHAALFFLFKPTTADAGSVVTVRLGGTPASFKPEDAERPLRNGIRLYLVPSDIAGEVGSRFDRRLHFVGRIVPDKNSRGVLSFTVPPLDTGAYNVAAWCPECARYSFGRTLFVQTVPRVSRYRRWMGLVVQLPAAADSCPATLRGAGGPPPGLAGRTPPSWFPQTPGWHGNGFLWTGIPLGGTFVPQPQQFQPDGSVLTKLYWLAAGVHGDLTLRGERLDATSPPLVVHRVNRGTMTGFRGSGTWATPVTFPSEGCWRLTARVRDISLSYVVKVVARP